MLAVTHGLGTSACLTREPRFCREAGLPCSAYIVWMVWMSGYARIYLPSSCFARSALRTSSC